MRIYQLDWHDRDEGTCYAWAGTQAEAKAKKKALLAEDANLAAIDVEIKEVDFPTDKQGLLGWLNAYFTRDNG